jgi:hypothetical protein
MHTFSKLFFFAFVIFCLGFKDVPREGAISKGQQPQIGIDNAGVVRVVFGRQDSVFCSTSTDKGNSFSKPVLVGVVAKMHLGMARGPQLACSAQFSVVTAMDKEGNIHFFQLNNIRKGKWRYMGLVNDVKASAPEGLMNIACDNKDNFYAAWLDIRLNKNNNVFFSSLPGGRKQWLKNTLVYRSPDEHVCECCRPSIAVKGVNVAVMFRNWLNGSRDLYLATSADNGKTFGRATKLGNDTWKMNSCTMDGGGVNFNEDNTINTTWQRKGVVYYCKPGQNERELGRGRDCSISADKNQVLVAMGSAGNVTYKNVTTNKETYVSKGSYLKTAILPDGKVLCVWEDEQTIKTLKN